MPFIDLNNDTVHEIFRHFVAIDWNGPFILTLVCSQWRYWVISKPILWSWIMIDELKPDWPERAAVCSTLSRDLPLHVVIRAVYLEQSVIRDISRRCVALFIEMPPTYAISRGDAVVDAVVPYGIEEYRSHKEIYKEIHSTIAVFLAASPPGQIRTVIGTGTCFTFSTWDIYEKLRAGMKFRDVVDGVSRNAITTLRLKQLKNDRVNLTPVQLAEIWSSLPLLPHPRYLELAESLIGLDNTRALPSILLPWLQVLTLDTRHSRTLLRYINSQQAAKNLGGQLFDVFDLLDLLQVPNILGMDLRGDSPRLREILPQLDRQFRPADLSPTVRDSYDAHAGLKVPSSFPWLHRLTLMVSPSGRSLVNNPIPAHLPTLLQQFIYLLPEGRSLRLIGGVELYPILLVVRTDTQVIELVYRDSPFNPLYEDKNSLKPFPLTLMNHDIQNLTLVAGFVPRSSYTGWWLAAANRVSIRHDSYMEELLVDWRSRRPTQIRNLDTHISSLLQTDPDGRFPAPDRSRLIHLTTLRCLSSTAEHIIRNFDTPQLTSINVTNGHANAEVMPLKILLGLLSEKRRQLTHLSTLAIEGVPEWQPLLNFLRASRRSRECRISEVKLLELPHPSILRSIVAALAGTGTEYKGDLMYIHEGEVGLDSGRCRGCARYGWIRYDHSDSDCTQRSTTNMVSITEYTL